MAERSVLERLERLEKEAAESRRRAAEADAALQAMRADDRARDDRLRAFEGELGSLLREVEEVKKALEAAKGDGKATAALTDRLGRRLEMIRDVLSRIVPGSCNTSEWGTIRATMGRVANTQ